MICHSNSIEKSLRVEELVPLLFKLDQNKEYDVVIKEHKDKRSLNANSYYWVIVNKVANKMKLNKEEVHFLMLQRYGQSIQIPLRPDVPAYDIFKYCEKITDGTLNGKPCTWWRYYRESHTYNTEEMSILIDGVVNEAEELGIETLPPNEIERLKSLWNTQKA